MPHFPAPTSEPPPRALVVPTSLELHADAALRRQAKLRSTTGMRGVLNKMGFNLGVSAAERGALDRREVIRTALPTMYQLGVISVKGGVGRTTLTGVLGSTFASMRSDRVIAVDANPHFGDLANRIARNGYGLTMRDLVHANDADLFSKVLGYTATNSADLSVLAAPWRNEVSDPLAGDEYDKAVDILRRHFNLALVDTGTGIMDSATERVLASSTALLVVASTVFSAVNGAVATFNWLHAHGLQHLIAKSTVALVDLRPSQPDIDVDAVEQLFAGLHRPTYRIPYDAHLAEGGPIDLRLLDKRTLGAVEHLAAGLAADFASHRSDPR